MCMECDDLPEAGHCPSHSHPAHSMLLFLDSQSETWKHASPLTVQMQVVLYSIATKDNLHSTSVFPLTISARLTSLYHQQQWLPLMTRTMLVKAAAGAPYWLASEPTEDPLAYVISSKHGGGGAECVPVSKENLTMYFHGQDSLEWVPVSKENLTMYFHGQDSLEWVFGLDQPWLN